MGNALLKSGDLQDLVAGYRRALLTRSDYAEAHSHLANAQKYYGGEPHVQQILDLDDLKDLSQGDRMNLAFALGKVHEDTSDCESSFKFLHAGI